MSVESTTVDRGKILGRHTAREAAIALQDIIRDEMDRHPPNCIDIFLGVLREFLPREALIVEGPKPMSDRQARAFGRQTMPYGNHRGEPVDDVPVRYLLHVTESNTTFDDDLRRYVLSQRFQDEQEEEDNAE